VAQAWLRQAAALASSREAYVAGEIALIEQRAAAKSRAAWPRAWKKAGKKKGRRWMKP